jgi:IS4 transposase
MVKLIDSTPIPLGKLCDWAKSNGRIRGLKMHVVFDPKADCPGILDITDANVNDAQIGRTGTIEPGATYVFDKGYCHYGWWTAIADPRRGLPHPTQDQYAPRRRRRAPHRAGARR